MKGTINDSTLGAIANSLRRKTKSDELILPHNMNIIIDNLPDPVEYPNFDEELY